MSQPIADFTEKNNANEILRAYMPGHKGKGEGFYGFDITEINGADSLYEAEGIIAESERQTAELFGAYKTLYSAGGATLCIQTMLALISRVIGDKSVLAFRNCHRAFVNACGLLGISPIWIMPRFTSSLVTGDITADTVKTALEKCRDNGNIPGCVYITSPDYMGKIAPVEDIARVCHDFGVLLAVDNAHGAYMRFTYGADGKPLHPLFRGADICCDSAHKTLPVLTGGAYLHIKDPGTEPYEGCAKELMSLFGSSSPSYLILRSLDRCGELLRQEGQEYFLCQQQAAEKLHERLSPYWQLYGDEWGKLTFFAPASGFNGTELAQALRQRGIECEYADECFTVLMLTGFTPREMERIGDIIMNIPQPRMAVPVPDYSGFTLPQQAVSIGEAMGSPSVRVDVSQAADRTAGLSPSHCPPGVAPIVSGEVFREDIIEILQRYGIFSVNVIA